MRLGAIIQKRLHLRAAAPDWVAAQAVAAAEPPRPAASLPQSAQPVKVRQVRRIRLCLCQAVFVVHGLPGTKAVCASNFNHWCIVGNWDPTAFRTCSKCILISRLCSQLAIGGRQEAYRDGAIDCVIKHIVAAGAAEDLSPPSINCQRMTCTQILKKTIASTRCLHTRRCRGKVKLTWRHTAVRHVLLKRKQRAEFNTRGCMVGDRLGTCAESSCTWYACKSRNAARRSWSDGLLKRLKRIQ